MRTSILFSVDVKVSCVALRTYAARWGPIQHIYYLIIHALLTIVAYFAYFK